MSTKIEKLNQWVEFKKLYTLKSNSSSRRLESQSHRDTSIENKNFENNKDEKIVQNASSIYTSWLNERRKNSYRKISTSETPKLRSQNIVQINTNIENDNKEKHSLDEHKFTSSHESKVNSKPPSNYSNNKQIKNLGALK